VRAVLDPNVIISALLNRQGTPARALQAWLDGSYELVVSEALLSELERALAYPKLRRHVEPHEARELVEFLRRGNRLTDDPTEVPSVRSPDPGDDYLIALAEATRAVLVSGDRHLLILRDQLPVFSPAEFVESLLT